MSDGWLVVWGILVNLVAAPIAGLPWLAIGHLPEWAMWPSGLAAFAWMTFVFYWANVVILRRIAGD